MIHLGYFLPAAATLTLPGVALLAVGGLALVGLIVHIVKMIKRRALPAEGLSKRPGKQKKHQGKALTLVGTHGTFAGKRFPVTGRMKLGRSTGECTVIYPREVTPVAQVHCLIYRQGDEAFLVSYDEKNGTQVNGELIAVNTATQLNPGDRITVGSALQEFVLE